MAAFEQRIKDRQLMRNATLTLTVERTPRFWLGTKFIIAAMWVGSRLMGCGFRVEGADG